MPNINEREHLSTGSMNHEDRPRDENKQPADHLKEAQGRSVEDIASIQNQSQNMNADLSETPEGNEAISESTSHIQLSGTNDHRPVERNQGSARAGARGTAAMDPETRKEVARKGGLAVSQNKQHMAEIGRKGGQSVSKNREHMAQIGRKGGAASRGHR